MFPTTAPSTSLRHVGTPAGALGGSEGWAAVIGRLAAGGGPGELLATGLDAALDLLVTDTVVLVHWADGRGEVVAAAGGPVPPLSSRPAEGAGRSAAGAALAAVSLDPRTDLIAVRESGPDFGSAELTDLRALAALLRWAGATGTEPVARLLQGFASRVVASLDPDDVLSAGAEAAAQLLRAEIAGVLLPDDTGAAVEMAASVGSSRLATARLRMRRGEGLAGRVLETGRAQRVDDYGTDPRSAPGLLALSDVEGTCSALAVPMLHEGRLQGVLSVWRRRREPFTDADEALSVALAELCAAALVNAVTHRDLRVRTQRNEAELARLRVEAGCSGAVVDLQTALNEVARERSDVLSVLRVVGSHAGCSAAIVDRDGRAVDWHTLTTPRDLGARLQAWLDGPNAALGPDEARVVELSSGWLVVTTIRAVGSTLGHLALGFPSAPGPERLLTAQQAAIAAAVLLAREQAALTAARRAQSEFVWDLLAGRLPDDVEAALRAQHLGSGFTLPARIVAVSMPGAAARATAGKLSADQVEMGRTALARLIGAALHRPAVGPPVLASRADVFAALVPVRGEDDEGDRAGLIEAMAAVTWPVGGPVLVGIGGRVDHVSRFPEGWREARLAVSAATPGVPAAFEDLGVLQFLLAPTSRADLDTFARRQLGRLLAYDAEHGTELVATLAAYLKAECNTRATAEEMFVHHRTITYRLSRIEEVGSVRLRSPEDRFELQLALKILSLAPSDPGEPDTGVPIP